MDDRVGASALARDLYTTLEWMRAMAQQPSYRDGSLEFEIEAVRKAARRALHVPPCRIGRMKLPTGMDDGGSPPQQLLPRSG